MTYYKITDSNGNAVDILTNISYVKYQEKHDIMLLCTIEDGEAILSSDGRYGWHILGLYNFKPNNNLYELSEISKYEYEQIKKKLK